LKESTKVVGGLASIRKDEEASSQVHMFALCQVHLRKKRRKKLRQE